MMIGLGEKGEVMVNYVVKDKLFVSDDGFKLGEGLSKEECENGFYDVMFVGIVINGDMLVVLVKGDKDLGYGFISKMILEFVFCLCKDVSLFGGFFIFVVVFGNKFICCLEEKVGLMFVIEK